MLAGKKTAEALPVLETAYSKDPTPANRAALAAAYVMNGQPDRGRPLLEAAVAAEPQSYELCMMYARALRDLKQYPAAANQFLEAAKLKPGDSKTWTELGSVLYMTGSFEPSLAAFDRARATGDDSAGVWFMRAIILDKLRQLKPALEAYGKFLSLSGGKNENQEFQARQRSRIIQRELEKR
jgi:Flp pilus assembly protein TadD